jgi:hypothetical protein
MKDENLYYHARPKSCGIQIPRGLTPNKILSSIFNHFDAASAFSVVGNGCIPCSFFYRYGTLKIGIDVIGRFLEPISYRSAVEILHPSLAVKNFLDLLSTFTNHFIYQCKRWGASSS